jgi:hypothetical protein
VWWEIGEERKASVKPLAIDLFCGLGGWTEGLLAEGYYVVGFDIEKHVYGEHRYPAQLVIQDVLTLHGRQFKDAALIVASPPCQAYSYRAMPWKRAKALPPPDNSLFEACFRIQREASEAAGRHIPLVVENVRGAIPWVGRSRWNYGSFHLWGDVPALMPIGTHKKMAGIKLSDVGFNVACAKRGVFPNEVSDHYIRTADDKRQHIGFSRRLGSALIAKIPLPLSRHIGRTYLPFTAPHTATTTASGS